MKYRLFAVWFSALVACESEGSIETKMNHEFEPIALESGGEITDLCQSWRLENDEPLYISAIEQRNEGGWHHSNWFFVPEGTYLPDPAIEGNDATEEGTWRCEDRGFRERGAAAFGGVFFAQSTQALREEQRFPNGAVLEIPPRSVVVGGVHLLNVSANDILSRLEFELSMRPEESIDTRLQLVNLDNASLEIPPGGESRFGMTCDMGSVYEAILDTTPDYSVYYVLPHYHEWGNYFRLSFVDENGTDRTVYETNQSIGEPLGSIIDPPISSEGAKYLRTECGYLNETGEVISWGFGGSEMCGSLIYIDGGIKIAGGSQGASIENGIEDGRRQFETPCGPLNGVSDLGGGAQGLPTCGAGNPFLTGGVTATQRIECDVAGAIVLGLDVEVSAIPRSEVRAGTAVDLELSSRTEIDAESAALLNTIARGEPAEIIGSTMELNLDAGAGTQSVVLGLTEVPCEVDYSVGAVPVVPPAATARVEVPSDATEIKVELGAFTLVTRTPSPSYLTTGPLPDDPMGQILSQCSFTDATIRIPVEP